MVRRQMEFPTGDAQDVAVTFDTLEPVPRASAG
jgi:hypothetical protein